MVYINGRTVSFRLSSSRRVALQQEPSERDSICKKILNSMKSSPLFYLHKQNLFGCDYGPVYAGNFIIFIIHHIRATQLESKQGERAISALGYGSVLGVHTDMYFNKGLYKFRILTKERRKKGLLCCCLLSCFSFLGYCICVSIYVNITSNSS